MTLLSTEVRAARPVDLPGVAAVLEDAFNEKMRTIFSDQPEKVRALLEAIYAGPVTRGYDGVLVAERGGRIIGTLLIEPMDFTPAETHAFENFAIRELGLLRTVWSSFLLWTVGHRPERGEAYISDLGVASDCRGEGVGPQMLAEAEAWARRHHRERLTLWVAGTNEHAQHVYENAGFAVARTRKSILTRLFFGIREWHFMEKPLRDPLALPA